MRLWERSIIGAGEGFAVGSDLLGKELYTRELLGLKGS